MEILDGHPVITGADSPQTVERALRKSVRFWNDNMPKQQAFSWTHKAQNAYGTVRDAFSIINDEVHCPDNEAVLYDINPDQLELALVAYGCKLLDEEPGEASEEVRLAQRN